MLSTFVSWEISQIIKNVYVLLRFKTEKVYFGNHKTKEFFILIKNV